MRDLQVSIEKRENRKCVCGRMGNLLFHSCFHFINRFTTCTGVRVSISSDSVPVREVEKERAQEGRGAGSRGEKSGEEGDGFLVYTFGTVESYFFWRDGRKGGVEK